VKSAIVVLVASTAAWFASQGVTAHVGAAGWKERFKQNNQGPGGANRVCFIPGDPTSGRDGKLKRGRQTSTNPRTLLEWDRTITISVWACDNSNRNDEGKQIAAVEALLERTIQAVQRAYDPETGQLVGAANVVWDGVTWNVANTDMAFGREVLVPITLKVPFLDVPYDVAFPEPIITKSWAKAPDVTEAAMVDYLAQAEWHCNSILGRDTNDGRTPATALQTVGEVIRRRGGRTWSLTPGQSLDLYIHESMTDADRQSLRVEVNDAAAHFGLHGALVQVVAGNLTAFTATSGNAKATITAPGLGAAHVKKLVHFVATDAWAETREDLGGGVLSVSDPQTYGGTHSSVTAITPGNTDAFVIYDCTVGNFAELEIHGSWDGGFSVWPSPVIVEHIRCTQIIRFAGAGDFYQRTFVNQCLFGDVKVTEGASVYFRNCLFTSAGNTALSAQIDAPIWFSGCVFSGGVVDFIAPTFGLHRQDSNVFDCALVVVYSNAGMEGSLRLFTTNPGVFSGLHIFQGVFISTHDTDVISGLNVGDHALVLSRGAQFTYQAGLTFTAVGSAGRQIAAGGYSAPTSLMPSLMSAVAGAVPALAPCTTWAEVQAAPFNGTAWNYTAMCGFTPDTI
jgi:hypothetical protein